MSTRGRLDRGSQVSGGLLVVSPAMCALLAPPLCAALRAWPAPPPEVVQVVSQVENLGRAHLASVGSGEVRSAMGTAGSGHDLTAAAAADLLGCTTRNVRDRAQRGTLPGHRSRRGWSFAVVDVLAARATQLGR